jgi:hypothetical protein
VGTAGAAASAAQPWRRRQPPPPLATDRGACGGAAWRALLQLLAAAQAGRGLVYHLRNIMIRAGILN